MKSLLVSMVYSNVFPAMDGIGTNLQRANMLAD